MARLPIQSDDASASEVAGRMPSLSLENIDEIAGLTLQYLKPDAAEFSEEDILTNLQLLCQLAKQPESKVTKQDAEQIRRLVSMASSAFSHDGPNLVLANSQAEKRQAKAQENSGRPPQRKELTRALLEGQQPRGIRDSKQVAQLIFDKKDGELKKIGEGEYGRCYLGRVTWNDGTVNKAVIKVFKPNGHIANTRGPEAIGNQQPGPMTAEEAKFYQQAIDKMRAEGVRIIKMGVYKATSKDAKESLGNIREREFVVVSELFGARGKTKFYGDLNSSALCIASREIRKDAMEQITRIANAGLRLSYDCMKFFEDPAKKYRVDNKRKGVVMDADVQGLCKARDYTRTNSKFIIEVARCISSPDLPEEELINVALNHANGKLTTHLKEETAKKLAERELWKREQLRIN